jgi:hypothetical protein
MEIVLDSVHFHRNEAETYAKALNPIAIFAITCALTTTLVFA